MHCVRSSVPSVSIATHVHAAVKMNSCLVLTLLLLVINTVTGTVIPMNGKKRLIRGTQVSHSGLQSLSEAEISVLPRIKRENENTKFCCYFHQTSSKYEDDVAECFNTTEYAEEFKAFSEAVDSTKTINISEIVVQEESQEMNTKCMLEKYGAINEEGGVIQEKLLGLMMEMYGNHQAWSSVAVKANEICVAQEKKEMEENEILKQFPYEVRVACIDEYMTLNCPEELRTEYESANSTCADYVEKDDE